MATTMEFANPHQLRPHSGFTWNSSPQQHRSPRRLQQQPRFQFEAPRSDAMEVDVSDHAGCNGTASRKRKADSQENERLCKRVSLLNLEHGGERLYIPVESPATSPSRANLTGTSINPTLPARRNSTMLEEPMRLDDTPHKVYIYDLDAELSSSDSESESGHLIFLPDIEKHLRSSRIPKAVLQPDDQGMYAGRDVKDMQLVLYGAPKSLSVPEDKDNVRRAIIEARHRAKEEGERVQDKIKEAQRKVQDMYPSPTKDTLNGMGTNGVALSCSGFVPKEEAQKPAGFSPGFGPAGGFEGTVNDDDAMDLDL